MALPLEDIIVLDLTRFTPGSSGVVILADMGADVIRVEIPSPPPKNVSMLNKDISGDDASQESEEIRLAYEARYRNRRSIALDLRSEEGRNIFYQLARKADVMVTDFSPQVSKRLGVDYESIKKIRPEIVYSAISSYGQDGPYRDLSGFDPNFISVGGLLGITGDVQGNHVLPGIPVADLTGGILSTIGILLALRVREKTGKGQFVDLSLADSAAYLVGLRHGPLYFSRGIKMRRGGRLSHTYRTKDNKYLSFSFGTPVYWENVCKALGMEQYTSYWREIQALGLEDSMGDPNQIRRKQKEAVDCLAGILETKTRDEWFSILSRAGAAVSPVNEMDEVFSDPQLLHRQMVVQVDHPKLGPIRQVGMPIKLSDTPGKIRRLAPLRGEHTKEILRWLGYQDAEITAFLRQKIVR